MTKVLHILSEREALEAQRVGFYEPVSLSEEGFIHCSYPEQLCRVADFLYKGHTDLVLLEIDKRRLDAELIDEDLYNYNSGELFPHIYGTVAWDAVAAVHDFPCRDDGTFELPASVSESERH